MKHILYTVLVSLYVLFGFVGCATNIENVPKNYKNHTKGRITFYHRYEDKFGSKVAMPSVRRATEGTTVAARRKFVFGTSLFIPALKNWIQKCSGQLSVQDRGSAVERLKASHGKAEVFDIYIEAPNRRIAQQRLKYLEANADRYMDVYY